MSSIRDLEKPKGCMKVLAFLKVSQPACISDVMRSTGLSQSGVYSSLERLKELGMLDFRIDKVRGSPNLCSLTDWGNRVGHLVCATVATLREISGLHDVGKYMAMPFGSFLILSYLYEKRGVTLTGVVTELDLSKESAANALRRITELGLTYCQVKRGFRYTIKEYKLTGEGENVSRLLDMINCALQWRTREPG